MARSIETTGGRRVAWGVILGIGLVVTCLISAFPFYWMLVTALQTGATLFSATPSFLPDLSQTGVFKVLLIERPVGRWMLNSAVVSLGSSLLSLALSITTAYALSRFDFIGKRALALALVFSQMLPTVLLLLPLFTLFQRLHLLNTLTCLVIANAAFITPVSIWILKSYFDTVPIEIEEAAQIDGASRLKILGHVVLPIARPAIVTCGIIAFFEAWNEFALAVTLVQEQERWVTSVGLASWIGRLTTPTEMMMAGAALFALPSILAFLFLQRHIISGLSAGAVRG